MNKKILAAAAAGVLFWFVFIRKKADGTTVAGGFKLGNGVTFGAPKPGASNAAQTTVPTGFKPQTTVAASPNAAVSGTSIGGVDFSKPIAAGVTYVGGKVADGVGALWDYLTGGSAPKATDTVEIPKVSSIPANTGVDTSYDNSAANAVGAVVSGDPQSAGYYAARSAPPKGVSAVKPKHHKKH